MHQPTPDNQPVDRAHDLMQHEYLPQPRQQAPHYDTVEPQWYERDDEDSIDLREYWRILVRRRWTVFSVLVLAFVGGLLVHFLTTPIFRATLLLQIEPEISKLLKYENILATDDENNFYETQYRLLRSRTLARRVMEELNLTNSENFLPLSEQSFFGSIRESITNTITGDRRSRVGKNPISEEIIQRNLTIQPVRRSRLVRIHYDGPNPREAALIVNAVAENYIDTTLERRFGASSYAKAFLDERIQQVRRDLEDSERRLVAYAREREIVSPDNKMATLAERLKEASGQFRAAETRRIEVEAKYNAMRAGSSSAHEEILNSPIIQSLKTRKQELQAEYDKNLRILKPGYPKMGQLRQQIADIGREISDESQNILESVEKDLMAYTAQEAGFRARVAEIKEEMLSLQDRSTDYRTLKREVETNHQLYERLLQRMKEIDVIAGVGSNNISVVDPAEIPARPYKPSLSRNLTLALAFGFLGGGLLAFLFEKLDDTLKTGEELEKHLGLPLLGVILDVSREEALDGEEVALLMHRAPNSTLAEAYRSIRTGLLFSTPNGAPKILHFTSSVPIEGKTTSSVSVATAFVQAGKVVLLVDADLRNPSLHKIFEISHDEHGLSSYLTGDLKPQEITYSSEIEQLFVIPAGPSPPNPVELLSSSKMLSLLNVAIERFDYIIVDGPPVVGLADALVLSNLAHATVFVVASGVPRLSVVDGSIKRLRSAKATLIGGVLTKVDHDSSRYSYYGYSYSYSYGTKTVQALDKPSV
ncbi:MAG: capsular exopolysaccharide family [Candidatus Kentron sp. G]|nr:MAG: capsular exopolysaccharide family [Candidatus Kentron sp. G]VFM97377.1 MAG: capsular exopolysaccharide family [Candidatus Kentron sp. G]VFM99837.1 MAG: capsular exopolysaccharide family [Candidatus Kentron sp. G]